VIVLQQTIYVQGPKMLWTLKTALRMGMGDLEVQYNKKPGKMIVCIILPGGYYVL
jgi:hypothetical protein